MSVKHSVFVLDKDGKPLTPCTPCKARKLLQGGKVKKVWSKFNTFGIQLLEDSRKETPVTVLGHDVGTKFEGFSVVCGNENPLNVQLNLPGKNEICRKNEQRRFLRKRRRSRLRGRKERICNRHRKSGWIAPSQYSVVKSRIKCSQSLLKIYPISHVAIEDVKFNHAKNRWGANFSTCEIGKISLYQEYALMGVSVTKFAGYETKHLRTHYGYKKVSDKATGGFASHCSDSLTLACHIGPGRALNPGRFIVVHDTYRPVRRQLVRINPRKGNIYLRFSKGTVKNLRKGLLLGTVHGKIATLTGESMSKFGWTNILTGASNYVKRVRWVSSNYYTT